MDPVLTKCGDRCDLCQVWRHNVVKKDERQGLADAWRKYFSQNLTHQDTVCDGCGTKSCIHIQLHGECKIQPCVTKKGLDFCAQCDSYPCAAFNERRLFTYERARANTDSFCPREFKKFIHTFDNGTRMDEIHSRGEHRLTNRREVPDQERMLKFIGPPAALAFAKLLEQLKDQEDLITALFYGGQNYGWQINVKKGAKAVFTLQPLRHKFSALCVFTAEELAALARPGLLSARTVAILGEGTQFHSGKWVVYTVTSEEHLQDLYAFLLVKRNGVEALDRHSSL
ncbi:MAG TPA: DUF3788 family protein, partial [Bacillota bacterium]|nr:DUF3788 family protein [Bacillota bacterium]